MKFADIEDIDEYRSALQKGALKGAGIGVGISVLATVLLKRKTSFFVGAGGLQKGLVYVAPVAFSTMVNMEHASRAFEDHKRIQQHGEVKEEDPQKNLSTSDKLKTWFSDNKYRVIVAGWAASLGGSFWLVNRDKYMTKAQKVVQARVYAQGATVAMLLLSVLLSVPTTNQKDAERKAAELQSHSWEHDIEYVEQANHPNSKGLSSHEQFESSKRSAAAIHHFKRSPGQITKSIQSEKRDKLPEKVGEKAKGEDLRHDKVKVRKNKALNKQSEGDDADDGEKNEKETEAKEDDGDKSKPESDDKDNEKGSEKDKGKEKEKK